MVKVSYKNNVFRCIGHADYAEKGKDIVCSAVSILCYTLAEETGNMRQNSGEMEIQSPDKDKVKVIMTGFKLLASQYPDHVGVES